MGWAVRSAICYISSLYMLNVSMELKTNRKVKFKLYLQYCIISCCRMSNYFIRFRNTCEYVKFVNQYWVGYFDIKIRFKSVSMEVGVKAFFDDVSILGRNFEILAPEFKCQYYLLET